MKHLLLSVLLGISLIGCNQQPDFSNQAAQRDFARKQDVLDAQNDAKITLIRSNNLLATEQVALKVARIRAEENRINEREASFEAKLAAQQPHAQVPSPGGFDNPWFTDSNEQPESAATLEAAKVESLMEECAANGKSALVYELGQNGNVISYDCR